MECLKRNYYPMPKEQIRLSCRPKEGHAAPQAVAHFISLPYAKKVQHTESH